MHKTVNKGLVIELWLFALRHPFDCSVAGVEGEEGEGGVWKLARSGGSESIC